VLILVSIQLRTARIGSDPHSPAAFYLSFLSARQPRTPAHMSVISSRSINTGHQMAAGGRRTVL